MRQWLFQTLSSITPLTDIVADRIDQGESIETTQFEKPFVFYTIGTDSDEGFSDEPRVGPHRQFFTIYVHDVPSDYTRIDTIIGIIKAALIGARGDKVMTVRYLETSTDMDDQTFETIFRYIRFQAIMEG